MTDEESRQGVSQFTEYIDGVCQTNEPFLPDIIEKQESIMPKII